jgi:zinc/manganese transport system substrate-binding protein
MRWRFQLWIVCLALLGCASPLCAQNRLSVVASFSILGDFVANVGGDRVSVTTLVGLNGDVHVYTPAPVDAKKVADARLLIINGLGLEGWLPRLVQASGSKAPIVVATKGIAPLKVGSAADPHAWQSVANAKVYVVNISDALVAADPANAEVFRGNAQSYLAKLDALDREVREAIAQIPESRRKAISTHGAFG